MNRFMSSISVVTLLGAHAFAGPPPEPEPEGTVFTYQGRLQQDGSLLSTDPGCGCDMDFELFETMTAFPGEVSIGTDVHSDVQVNKGLFTVELDFGFNPFDGTEKWLQVTLTCPGVGCGGGAGPTGTLTGRQRLRPTPYALHAVSPWESNPDNTAVVFESEVESSLSLYADVIGASGGPYSNQLTTWFDGSFRLFNNGTQRMRIDDAGRMTLGIPSTSNTFSPPATLWVDPDGLLSPDAHVVLDGRPGATARMTLLTAGDPQQIRFEDDLAGVRWSVDFDPARNDSLTINAPLDAGDVMTFQPNGYVGILTSAPNSPLDVNGDCRVAETLLAGKIEVSTVDPFIDFHHNNDPGDYTYRIQNVSQGLKFVSDTADNVVVMRHGGNVGIGTISPNWLLDVNGVMHADSCDCPSDARLKTEVQTLRDALAIVDGLRGVRFRWRHDVWPEREFSAEPQIGLIAQEVMETVPEVVHQGANGYFAMDYSRLTPVLIQAVQELHGIVQDKDELIAAQRRDIEDMNERLARLERLVLAGSAREVSP